MNNENVGIQGEELLDLFAREAAKVDSLIFDTRNDTKLNQRWQTWAEIRGTCRIMDLDQDIPVFVRACRETVKIEKKKVKVVMIIFEYHDLHTETLDQALTMRQECGVYNRETECWEHVTEGFYTILYQFIASVGKDTGRIRY